MTEKKPRVYQVAKDFNVSSEALLEILRGLGVPAKSHMSTLDPSAIDRVRDKFQEEKEAVKADDARRQEARAAQSGESPAPVAEEVPPVASTPAVEVAPETPAAPAVPAAPKPPETPEVAPAPPRAAEPPRPTPPPAAPAAETPSGPRPRPARTSAAEMAGRPTPRNAPGLRSGRLGPARPRTDRRRQTKTDKSAKDAVKDTLRNIRVGEGSKTYKKPVVEAPAAVATEDMGQHIRITERATVAQLADKLSVPIAQVIGKLMALGVMATQNQSLDKDTIETVALEFEYGVRFEAEVGADLLEDDIEDKDEDLVPRPPVVTVMGHVDHGKTSLLDSIRKANVVAGEKGGITQHIGAYEVELADGRKVAFLDTPGHEAFTAMRARGAQATDIVILVVAADDRVMPQTREAIDHAKAAEVPIVVAINKIDKPEANVPYLKQDLASHNLLIEEFGGKVPAVEISAKKGIGIDELLDIVLLQADLLELKANPSRHARGVVIESKVEQGRGIVATILVQNGTLAVGEPFVCGHQFGKVRSMSDERGRRVKKAPPGTPVEVTGWSGSPSAGDIFSVTKSEGDARQIGMERQLKERDRLHRSGGPMRLVDFTAAQIKELNLIIKADVAGSVEVLRDQVEAIKHEEVGVKVISAGVGQITEGDILLATASAAVVIGFNTKTDPNAAAAALRDKVEVRHYNIIYEVVEDITSALSGMLKPEEVEKRMSSVEVRAVFKLTKAGTVAGCYVKDGTVNRGHRARLIREGEVVFEGELDSVKRFKDDVREVAAGFECGIGLRNHNDVREGDIIETFIVEEVARRI